MSSPIIWGGTGQGKLISNPTAGYLTTDASGNISTVNPGVGALAYAQAYFNSGYSWYTSSASFVDPTFNTAGTFAVRASSGITVTAAGSNLPGITFTPPSTTATYQITATYGAYSQTSGGVIASQMTDGTTVISVSGLSSSPGTNYEQQTITGIYKPGTTSAVTVKLQFTNVNGTGVINIVGASPTIAIEWTIVRIDALVTSGGSGITRSINSISSPTTAGATASTDYVYLVSGTTTLTLPTAVGNTNLYTVKNTGANTVTIATTSAQTIDGSSTASMPVANTSLSLISDGSNWRLV